MYAMMVYNFEIEYIVLIDPDSKRNVVVNID